MADKYCSIAAANLYQCSLKCDFLHFTGSDNKTAIGKYFLIYYLMIIKIFIILIAVDP